MMKFLKEGELPGCFENLYFDFRQSVNSTPSPLFRFSGTIVGVGDNKSSVWTNSEWRSLKVSMGLHFNLFIFSFFIFCSLYLVEFNTLKAFRVCFNFG